MLLDLHDSSADHDSSMRADEYEEPESVFIPNNAPTRLNATAAATAPAALSAAAAAPAEVAPSGLAGLVSYGSDDDEDETPAPAATVSAIPAAAVTTATSYASAAASVRSPSPPLPRGWTACKDDESGDTYWWNENTDETTWDRPACSATVTVAATDATQTKSKEEAADATTANAVSVSATPSPPPTAAAAAAAINAPPGVAKKASVTVDAEMKEGDVGHSVAAPVASTAAPAAASPASPDVAPAVTQTTEQPADDNANNGDDDEDAAAEDDLDGAPIDNEIYPLPAGWHEVERAPDAVSAGSGPSSYFFNENTGETSWDRPKLNATEKAQFRAARLEQERFRALQVRAENEIAAAAARKEKEERATFLPAAAGSCSQALLISALTAGLQARLRPCLAQSMAPFASASVGESLSPLLRFHTVLESRIKDWMELLAETPTPALEVIEHAESLWVARLTQATVEVDAVLKAEESWRAERTQMLATQQYEAATMQHQQYLATQMTQQPQMAYPPPQPMMTAVQGFAPQPRTMPMQHGYAMPPQPMRQHQPMQPVGMQRFGPPPPPLPAAAAVAPAPAAVAAAPAPSSGFVHPSRSAHVIVGKPAFAAGVPPPPASRGGAGQKRSATAAASSGQSGAAAALAEGGPKKKRVDSQDSKQLGRMVSFDRIARAAHSALCYVLCFALTVECSALSVCGVRAGWSGVQVDCCGRSDGARGA